MRIFEIVEPEPKTAENPKTQPSKNRGASSVPGKSTSKNIKNLAMAMMLYGSSAAVNATDKGTYAIIDGLVPVAKETHALVAPQLPFSMPYVTIVNIPMQGAHCGGQCLREIAAYYKNGVVYLNNKLDWTKEENKALFAHEMTHHFQDELGMLNAPNKNACSNRKEMELQAFKSQMNYLKARGLPFNHSELDDLVKSSTKVVCN